MVLRRYVLILLITLKDLSLVEFVAEIKWSNVRTCNVKRDDMVWMNFLTP